MGEEIQWEAEKKDGNQKTEKETEFAIEISFPPLGPPGTPTSQMMILLSPYVQKVFNHVVKFFPGVKFRKDLYK
jgi:hypothetical protein